MPVRPIGILGAMPQEIDGLAELLEGASTVERGLRTYFRGKLFGRDVVLVYTRCGKVAAATTTTHLIIEEGVQEILFTGVAGGADPRIKVGDIVVAEALIQHDMDATPLFPRHEIPLLGRDRFPLDSERVRDAVEVARRYVVEHHGKIDSDILKQLNLHQPAIHSGTIASGDKFFAARGELVELKRRLPDVLCVEMEGAAVAQVCYEYGVPLTVFRTISDSADEGSPVDFTVFMEKVACRYSRGLLQALLCSGSDS